MKKAIRYFLLAVLAVCVVTAALNLTVIAVTDERIVPAEEAGTADCILVLGCGLTEEGTPGRMLSLRLDTAIDLYLRGASNRLLMSGDHGRKGYDEVNAMKRYAVEHGVPAEDVFMDHAGFCTHDSLVRAKSIFGCESVIIVTQRYHLYRSLWNADGQGLEARGVAAEMYDYGLRYTAYLNAREVLARVKDVAVNLLRMPAQIMGEPIDIRGSGALTDDAETAAWLAEVTAE